MRPDSGHSRSSPSSQQTNLRTQDSELHSQSINRTNVSNTPGLASSAAATSTATGNAGNKGLETDFFSAERDDGNGLIPGDMSYTNGVATVRTQMTTTGMTNNGMTRNQPNIHQPFGRLSDIRESNSEYSVKESSSLPGGGLQEQKDAPSNGLQDQKAQSPLEQSEKRVATPQQSHQQSRASNRLRTALGAGEGQRDGQRGDEEESEEEQVFDSERKAAREGREYTANKNNEDNEEEGDDGDEEYEEDFEDYEEWATLFSPFFLFFAGYFSSAFSWCAFSGENTMAF